MYNKVILLGRMTEDPKLNKTKDDVSVTAFTIAVDREHHKKGEKKITDFISCVAWRDNAEYIARFWEKSRPILIEGELQTKKYTDKNGQERHAVEVLVERASSVGDNRVYSANPRRETSTI